MRISWLVPLLALAQAQQIHVGSTHTLRTEPGGAAGEAVGFSSEPELEPAELLRRAKAHLQTITKHSAPVTHPPSWSSSSFGGPSSLLRLVEMSPGGAPIRSLRRAMNFLYTGSPTAGAGTGLQKRWSIKGVLAKAGSLLSRESEDVLVALFGRDWRDEELFLKPNSVLSLAEVEEGIQEILKMAHEAAERGEGEAWLFLGDLHLTGHLTLPANPSQAVEAYTTASERYGLPDAQYKLGFLYSSNFANSTAHVEGVGEQGSALVHYTFAGLSGHGPAKMTLGYRHWVGIGAKKSCEDALGWYKSAAQEAVRAFNAGPPGGRHLPPPKIRLADYAGGVYGPGASASYRIPITGGSNSQTLQEWEDLIEWYTFHAEKNDDLKYILLLGRVLYNGFGGEGLGGARRQQSRLNVGTVPLDDRLAEGGRDFRGALKWFRKAARKVWAAEPVEAVRDPDWAKKTPAAQAQLGFYDAAKDPKVRGVTDQEVMYGATAAGMLGKMYLRGEGNPQQFGKAFIWFMRGAAQGDKESHNGLGIMYRDGLGVGRDLKKANAYFHSAAQADHAEAQVNLGKYHLGMGEFEAAQRFFELAVRLDSHRQPDLFQAYYYLAELHSRTGSQACPTAVSFYKAVAERADWDHELWWEAERARLAGDERTALLGYWIMAERGYEVAQNNVAWILDRNKQRLRVPALDGVHEPSELDRLALTFWTRSAAQDNMDALVKTGDCYFDGIGTLDGEPMLDKAAAAYQSAASSRVSAMSMWNLGWMHENGRGVAKDFHLAKRFYDLAIETSLEAYFPATLSLLGLYARSLYYTLLGTDDELKKLSLFSGPAASTPAEMLAAQAPTVKAWSVERTWHAVQRAWGFEPNPPPTQPAAAAAAGARDQGAAAQAAFDDVQKKLDDLMRGFGQGGEAQGGQDWADRQRRVGEEDEDEWLLNDGAEGDFGGTVAIVMLCIFLGVLFIMRQNALVGPQQQQHQHQPPPPAAPAQGAPAPAPGAAPTPAAGAPEAPPVQAQNDENEEQEVDIADG